MSHQKSSAKFRTWDNVAFVRKGAIKSTEVENPYAVHTVEYHLIDFIQKFEGSTLHDIPNLADKIVARLQ